MPQNINYWNAFKPRKIYIIYSFINCYSILLSQSKITAMTLIGFFVFELLYDVMIHERN